MDEAWLARQRMRRFYDCDMCHDRVWIEDAMPIFRGLRLCGRCYTLFLKVTISGMARRDARMESHIWNEDCNTGLDRIPDGSVDLVMMDPPYLLETCGGGPSALSTVCITGSYPRCRRASI